MEQPIHEPTSIQKIDQITNWLMAVIVLIPFLISAGSLVNLAGENGVSFPILYPLMVDGGLVIFKALALRESLRGRRDYYTWGMAVALTGISVALNVLHVPATLSNLTLARCMAALPPLVILAAFIAVSRRIEQEVTVTESCKETAVATLSGILQTIETRRQELDGLIIQKTAELDKLLETKTAELDSLVAQVDQLSVQRDTLTVQLSRLNVVQHPSSWTAELDSHRPTIQPVTTNLDSIGQQPSRLQPSKLDATVQQNEVELDNRLSKKAEQIHRLLDFVGQNPAASLSEIADYIGRSRSTAGNYMSELTAKGILHKNGKGWEVKLG